MYGLWTGHMGVDAFLHSGMIDTTFFCVYFISSHHGFCIYPKMKQFQHCIHEQIMPYPFFKEYEVRCVVYTPENNSLAQELASQAHQSRGTTSALRATSVALHVHLESHFGSRVDSRLLVLAL